MTLNNVAIGKRIQTVRKKRGLSQFTLAGIVDRSPGYISYIETGFKSMSLETFVGKCPPGVLGRVAGRLPGKYGEGVQPQLRLYSS